MLGSILSIKLCLEKMKSHVLICKSASMHTQNLHMQYKLK